MDLFPRQSSAVLSDCGTYRYVLTRTWGPPDHRGPLVWLMLNPSTADATQDDPTIRRCMGFARDRNYPGIKVVNLYALRSPRPAALWKHADPVGPENDRYLVDETAGLFVVAAWGGNAKAGRVREVMDLIRDGALAIECLGLTKGGHPRHPLYMPGGARLVPFTVKE